MPLLLSFLCKISWNTFTYSYLNFSSQILSSFLANPWIFQWPINDKSVPLVAVVGKKKTEGTVENKTQVVVSPEIEETAANWSGDSVTFHGFDRQLFECFTTIMMAWRWPVSHELPIGTNLGWWSSRKNPGRVDPIIFVIRMVWRWPASHDLPIGTYISWWRGRKWKWNLSRVRRYLW